MTENNEFSLTPEREELLRAKYPSKTRTTNRGVIEFGYQKKEGDPLSLDPVIPDLHWLDHAFDAVDSGASLREASEWFSKKSGSELTYQGFSNLWAKHRGSDPNNPRRIRLDEQQNRIKPKTKREAKRAKKVREIAHQKRMATIYRKKAEAQEEKLRVYKKREEKKQEDLSPVKIATEIEIPEELERAPVFQPNPGPQTEFLMRPERQVLYGGAAGGGKSYALLADPMRYFDNPNFSGLLVRRTNDELRELIWKSNTLYKAAYPDAVWGAKASEWRFPSGARLWITYLERDEDVLRYQGQAFTWIGFDELTQYSSPFAWNYLATRLRDASGTLPLIMRATTNPGGPGHGWVKKMFIDPAPYGKPFAATDIDTGKPIIIPVGNKNFPESKWGKPVFKRIFIPAKLEDNPYLNNDGEYRMNIMSGSETSQRQLLDGDWDVADGAAFSEFRAKDHVIEPFEIPSSWRRFRSCDFGYSSYSAVHWFAVEPQTDRLYVYRELYLAKHTGRDLARAILAAEEKGERIDYGVLDSSCWSVRGNTGPTIAEEMISEGTRWRPSDRTNGARVAGKNLFHEYLKLQEYDGKPKIQFFNTCRQIITDLPIIPADPKGGDDIDERYQSDHAYDSVRYGIMSRPRAINSWETRYTSALNYQPVDQVFGY